MGEDKKRLAWVRRVPRIGEVLEKNLSLLEQLGIKQKVGAVVSAGLYTAGIWLWSNVPWYVAIGVFLIATYIVLGIFHRIQLIRAASKFDPAAYEKLGDDLVELSRDIFRFLADRQRDHAERRGRNTGNDLDVRQQWQEDRDFEAVTGRLFFERFGPKVLGSLALLRRLGVELPPHMVHSAKTRPEGLPQFLAVMGDLLSRGFIKEAVETSKDRNFIWEIEH